MKKSFNNLWNVINAIKNGRSGKAAIVQTFLSKILILGANMATGIITARFLGAAGRGDLAVMILWPQFLAYLLTFGLPSALIYHIRSHQSEKSQLFSAAFWLGLVLGCLATGIGVIFIPQWLSQYPNSVIRSAQWFMLASPISLLSLIGASALESQEEFRAANYSRYSSPLLTLTVLLILLLTQQLSPFTAALAYMIPALVVFCWIIYTLKKYFNFTLDNLGVSYQKLINYGLRSYGIDLLKVLSGRIGQALVVSLLTPVDMGLYAVAISLSRLLNIFESAMITVLLPKTAARPIPEIVALTVKGARVTTFLTVICVAPLMLICPWLLTLLYGEEFSEAVPVFRILLIQVTIEGTAWVLAQTFIAAGKPGIVTILQVVGLSSNVPLMLILIPKYGLVGAGLAMLIATAIRFIFIMVSFPVILKLNPPSLLISKHDLMNIKQLASNK